MRWHRMVSIPLRHLVGHRQVCGSTSVPHFGRLRFVVIVTFLGLPAPLPGQTIQGRLLETRTGVPIEGALVTLVTEDHRQADGYLTNSAGRFRLRASVGGRFTVRAERIGFETVTSEPIELHRDQVFSLLLETEQVPISLEGLTVEGEQQCLVRPAEGQELAWVWEEARKSLTAQNWTERENLYEYLVTNYEREMDARTHLVLSEERESLTKVARIPIRSLPAEDLMTDGFIRELEEEGFQYFAPDASVLLSDIFLDSHCFRLTAREEAPSSIGLHFEPIRSGGLPDVTGTLWLERTTAELQTLEFWYTWAPYPEGAGYGRGLIEFEGLPNGAWIVRKWWIRMPNVSPWRNPAKWGQTEYRLTTLTEAGGEVRQIFSSDRPILEEPAAGYVSGMVWDSTTNAPLEGATVFLSGTSFHATTDTTGRFLLEGVAEGRFRIAFTHPRLDLLGITDPGTEVDVTLGEPASVRLSIPSARSILAGRCGEGDEHTRAMAGTVLLGGTEHPIPEASVEATWRSVNREGAATRESVRAVTEGDGRFFLCGLPVADPIDIRASFLDHEGAPVRMEAGVDPTLGVDLQLHLPPGTLTYRTSARETEIPGGDQGIQGRILEPSSGTPVRNAEVTLKRPSGAGIATVPTNDRGFFRIPVPVPGTYALRATALGYQDVKADSLAVSDGKMLVVEVEMPPQPIDLEPVIVVAESRDTHLELQGFYERAEKGFGHFITPEELEERDPRDWEDVLRPIPNIRVTRTAYGVGFMVRKPWAGGLEERQSSPGLCEPRLIVDGFPVPSTRRRQGIPPQGVHLDQFVSVSDISGIEVHIRATSVPMQYGGSSGSCGVIIVWTKGG